MIRPIAFLVATQQPAGAPNVATRIGEPNTIAVVFFFVFIAITLGITYWAARRTRTTEEFYAAGRSITPGQNGFALAGDYMSAASFLGIAGLVSTTGFDGLIYSTGWLVGWPVVLFLIAEPLRNLGKYTFADVVAARLRQTRTPATTMTSTIAANSQGRVRGLSTKPPQGALGGSNAPAGTVRAVFRFSKVMTTRSSGM